MKMTSKMARSIRAGLTPPPCNFECCSCNVDDFVPTPLNKVAEQLVEEQKPAHYDGMLIDDMRKSAEFLFAGDDFQKIDAAKRLQFQHVSHLAKKYYKPTNSRS